MSLCWCYKISLAFSHTRELADGAAVYLLDKKQTVVKDEGQRASNAALDCTVYMLF